VAAWAQDSGIDPGRVYLGEFGLPYTIDEASRERWLRDVREAAEVFGMRWAAFAHDAGNMPLTSWSKGQSGKQGPLLPFVASALLSPRRPLLVQTDAILAAMPQPANEPRRVLIDTTIRSLQDAGLWSRIGYLMLVSNTQQASLINWVAPSRVSKVAGSPVFRADAYIGGNGRDAVVRTDFTVTSGDDIMVAVFRAANPTRPADPASKTADLRTPFDSLGDFAPKIEAWRYPPAVLTRPGFAAATASPGGGYNLYDGSGRPVATISTGVALPPPRDALGLFRRTTGGGYGEDRLSAVIVAHAITAEQVRRLRDIVTSYFEALGNEEKS
jgi:hypothetical protein